MIELIDRLATLIFGLALIGLCLQLRAKNIPVFHPAIISCLFWAVIILSVSLMPLEVLINPFSALFIFACCVAYSFPAFLWRFKPVNNRLSSQQLHILAYCNSLSSSRFLVIIGFVLAILSLLTGFFSVLQSGITAEQLLIETLQTSGYYAARRGNGYVEAGILQLVCTSSAYACATIGGIIQSFDKKRIVSKRFTLIFILPGVSAMVFQSSKIIFIYCIILFLSATLMKAYSSGVSSVSLSSLGYTVVLILLCIPFVIFSFVSREGYGLDEGIDRLLFAVRSYVWGPIVSFSDFFGSLIADPTVDNYRNLNFRFGELTFGSIYSFIGVEVKYDEFIYTEAPLFEGIIQSNIFTAFRGAIIDFGVLGVILLSFVAGILASLAFNAIYNVKSFVDFVIVFVVNIHVVATIFCSYLSSPFATRWLLFNIVIVVSLLLLSGLNLVRRLPLGFFWKVFRRV